MLAEKMDCEKGGRKNAVSIFAEKKCYAKVAIRLEGSHGAQCVQERQTGCHYLSGCSQKICGEKKLLEDERGGCEDTEDSERASEDCQIQEPIPGDEKFRSNLSDLVEKNISEKKIS